MVLIGTIPLLSTAQVDSTLTTQINGAWKEVITVNLRTGDSTLSDSGRVLVLEYANGQLNYLVTPTTGNLYRGESIPAPLVFCLNASVRALIGRDGFLTTLSTTKMVFASEGFCFVYQRQ